ncbi:MAG: tetratricopeptide repeat protein [Isosphaeraceae bacterium]|nr:tetratricopeptide repeat protein [Isosphaeraceae bacterium]
MSSAFHRGIVLFHQNRFDLAGREFRQDLAQDPDNAMGHAFLALCLSQADENAEALHEAAEAVRLDPGQAFGHYVRGVILRDLHQLPDAEAAAREAIRLDPDDPNHFALLSSIALQRRNWTESLATAEQGLALDPEHGLCTNLRAMSLVNLGRKDEAAQTLGSALANDPEDPFTHANQGWAYLHQGDHAKALEHFREALRLDPNNEWARVGVIEALKAHHLLYRLMLRFTLWMSRKSTTAQWGIMLAFVFGRRFLDGLARQNPALKPYIEPVLLLTFGFLLLTWVASPLFNLLLRLNKFGRLALSAEQRLESSVIGGCFILAACFFLASLGFESNLTYVGVRFFGLLLFPLVVTFHRPAGKPRQVMAGVPALIAACALPAFAFVLFGSSSPLGNVEVAREWFDYFILGAILSTWLPAVLQSRG